MLGDIKKWHGVRGMRYGKMVCGSRYPNKSCSRAVVQSCSQILYFIKTCRTAELQNCLTAEPQNLQNRADARIF